MLSEAPVCFYPPGPSELAPGLWMTGGFRFSGSQFLQVVNSVGGQRHRWTEGGEGVAAVPAVAAAKVAVEEHSDRLE